jgi:hypothetical protein
MLDDLVDGYLAFWGRGWQNGKVEPAFPSSHPGAPMSDLDDAEPLDANGPPSLELFMTVVRVAEWPRMVRWYLDTLGLAAVLLDHENQFALLAAGQGRLGLQGVKGFRDPTARHKVRLVFQVPDVDSERGKLIERGVFVTEPFNNAEEGYREVRLRDPDGNSLTLFAWIDRARDNRFTREPLSGE